MPKIIPIGSRALIEPVPRQEKSAGGILLPERSRETRDEGIVRAIGEGDVSESVAVQKAYFQVGDRVLLADVQGEEIWSEGRKCVLVHFTKILAVIKP